MPTDDASDVTKALAAFGAPSIRYRSFGQGQGRPAPLIVPRPSAVPIAVELPSVGPAPIEPALHGERSWPSPTELDPDPAWATPAPTPLPGGRAMPLAEWAPPISAEPSTVAATRPTPLPAPLPGPMALLPTGLLPPHEPVERRSSMIPVRVAPHPSIDIPPTPAPAPVPPAALVRAPTPGPIPGPIPGPDPAQAPTPRTAYAPSAPGSPASSRSLAEVFNLLASAPHAPAPAGPAPAMFRRD